MQIREYSSEIFRSHGTFDKLLRPDLCAQSPQSPSPGSAATIKELPPDDSSNSTDSFLIDGINTAKCCPPDAFPSLMKLLSLNLDDDDDDDDDNEGGRNTNPNSSDSLENMAADVDIKRSYSLLGIGEFPSNLTQASPTTTSDFSTLQCESDITSRSHDTMIMEQPRVLGHLSGIDDSLNEGSYEKEQELKSGTNPVVIFLNERKPVSLESSRNSASEVDNICL